MISNSSSSDSSSSSSSIDSDIGVSVTGGHKSSASSGSMVAASGLEGILVLGAYDKT